ncbi:class A beta-lactamase-related serine hydrolase [Sphingomonas koreensis]|nr:CubicO group peptidase (beta-lactamase class C family) [Sphingomonas koreensis]RSU57116.1 class A beta-lactamase-related serine hydrolase [Sphingomonas koreensis]RSU65406.1 class A beta-lactamase-related serine hydrolase [Sphingomonas koreensis]
MSATGSTNRSWSRRHLIGAMAATPWLLPGRPTASGLTPGPLADLPLDGAPGLAAGVVRNGKVVIAGGEGSVRSGSQTAPDAQTVFEIGSLTKIFTASLIFQLQEEARLRTEIPIGSYVAELPARWRELTLAQLLSHTSGLPEYLDESNFFAVMGQDLKPREIVAMATDRPMQFAPGEKHAYNNLGFILLGMAAEAVTGNGYWDELERRFFAPAGMLSTGPRNRLPGNAPCASGHFWRGDSYEDNPPRSAPGATWSAGGLLSTAADINRWSVALDRGTILSAEVRRRMWTPAQLANGQPAGWGYGWEVETVGGRTIVSHGGGTAGFSCWYRRDVSQPLSTIILTNQNGRADPKAMTGRLLELMARG